MRCWAFWILGSLSFATGAQAQGTSASPSPFEASVSAPELLHFVAAPYPKAAEAAQLEAEVVLSLDIDETGHVTAERVVQAAGHGFDEAAERAAAQFLFRPARRGERPVHSRILYRYTFHFQAPPAEPTVAPGRLLGRVKLALDNSAVAAARVRVFLGAELLAERTTTADGRFASVELKAGVCHVLVEAPGFEPYSVDETVTAGEETEVAYGLVPRAEVETTIVVQGTRPTREVTRRTVSRRELSRIPGTSGDALRALQNLPGVARPPALSGLLVVRGNADQTTPVFVDGLWIPNVYHFGGLSSVVPTEMLDEINFYPGNFSVKYGRALAGVVDAHLRETRGDGKYHGLLQLDLIDARIMAEGPVPGLKGWNFIGGIRRSHVDAWLAPLLRQRNTSITAAPVYYDYQFIVDKRPSPDSYLRIGLLGFDDRLALINRASPEAGKFDTVNATVGGGAIYQAKLSDHVRLDTSLSTARSHQRIAVSTTKFDLVAYGTIARADLQWQLRPGVTLRSGYDCLFAPYRAYGAIPQKGGANAPDIGPSVTTPSSAFDRQALFFAPALYSEFDLRPSSRLQLISGVRADYTLENARLDISPRLVARYKLAAGRFGTTLKAGSGLFHQAPGLLEFLLKSPDTDLRSQRSFQNSLGIEQPLTEQVTLSLEGFFNLLDNLVSRQPDARGVLQYNNFGKGRIFGSELLLRYAADDRFFGWISYTLSRSERSWVPGEPVTLFEFDQTHILTALGSYELGRGWEIGGRFRYVTGNLYTPCSSSLFSSTGSAYVCVPAAINSQRLPAFHQLDIRIDKRFQFRNFALGVYLDLINVYNRQNPDLIQYNYDFSQSRPETASLPIVPSLGIRGEF
jgi:TonB family protein